MSRRGTESASARDDRCLIIAEAGVNHGGSVEMALALVDAAVEAGADAVKFQSYRTDLLVREDAPQAAYQARNAPAASQADMLRALELSAEAHRRIAEYCTERGITFLSTPFDPPSLGLLLELGVPRLKVASGELTNGPMLLVMARTGLPMIVSTGMATLDEVADALAVIAIGRDGSDDAPRLPVRADARRRVESDPSLVGDVTLLHCTSSYPAPPESVNLRAMDTLAQTFGLPVGYSDHTEGITVAVAAVARGAVIIEKHLTIDRTLPGPDHATSLEPHRFTDLVTQIRTVQRALGDGEKRVTPLEEEVRRVARRSLVAARDLSSEHPMSEGDLIALRPGGGVGPSELWDRLGLTPERSLLRGDALE
jgi:N-acetylneuraminate synthase